MIKYKLFCKNCESKFDIKTIKNILNSYCKNIVSNIKIINRNSYIIFLNIEKEFNVNSCEFNLIQGILISHKMNQTYRLESLGKFLNISFNKNVNIYHKYMKYYENPKIGLKNTNYL